jgi:hypothetical protein
MLFTPPYQYMRNMLAAYNVNLIRCEFSREICARVSQLGLRKRTIVLAFI